MGVAAYARGSKLIREQIQAAMRPTEFVMMDELNQLPKDTTAQKPFGPIHFVHDHHGWWATCPTTGYGFLYDSLRQAVRRWRVTIIGYDNGTWIGEPEAA